METLDLIRVWLKSTSLSCIDARSINNNETTVSPFRCSRRRLRQVQQSLRSNPSFVPQDHHQEKPRTNLPYTIKYSCHQYPLFRLHDWCLATTPTTLNLANLP